MKVSVVDDFAAIIGIDWADKKHDICEIPAGSSDKLFSVISSKPQALNEWAASLKKRYPNLAIAVVWLAHKLIVITMTSYPKPYDIIARFNAQGAIRKANSR